MEIFLIKWHLSTMFKICPDGKERQKVYVDGYES